MPTIDDWLEIVLRDFGDTPMARTRVAVIDLDPDRPDAVADRLPDATSWVTPGAHRLLLTIGDAVTSLDGFVDDPAAAAVEIASHLQDAVMDELNRPWPEIGTVLEPRLGAGRRPEWAGRGVVCAFGELRNRLHA